MSTTYAENNLRRPMKKQLSYVSLTIGLLLAVGLFTVSAHDRDNKVRAKLTGRQEVPVVSTQASGDFEARIEDDKVTFKLSYELEGPVAPTQAHIHLGQRTANGGVMVFLCGGPRPACPASPATVEGTITGADIIALGTQQIPGGAVDPTGAFNEFVSALRNGTTYANVHTPTSPGGEIRGQVRVDNGRHRGHDDH
jgi:CHRD domain